MYWRRLKNVDSRSQQILLTNILELQELYAELMDTRWGANTHSAEAVRLEIIDRLERWERGEFYSEPNRG